MPIKIWVGVRARQLISSVLSTRGISPTSLSANVGKGIRSAGPVERKEVE